MNTVNSFRDVGWQRAEGEHELAMRIPREDLAPYGFLRVERDGKRVLAITTTKGDSISVREFMRVWNFARRCRQRRESATVGMRFSDYGIARKPMSATHYGDVRHGCTLICWDELLFVARALGLKGA